MGTPKYAERVAILETKFDALKETVEVGFEQLGKKIDNISPNGQTPRLIHMGKTLGDAEDVAIIASMVESHKRWGWLLRPVIKLRGGLVNAAVWLAAGAVLTWVHSILHAAVPAIP